jgi:MFS transporter, FHS family, glucose/mannose:H+ symporter
MGVSRRGPAGRAALSANTVVAFLALGLSGATIGPALPWMAQHWAVRLEDAGALFTALFAGSCITVPLSGLLMDRIGRKPVLVAALALMGAGLGGFAFAPGLGVALAWAMVLGFGWGGLDVTLNVFVADLYPDARGAALNLTNVFFGVGALVGPLLIAAALTLAGTPQIVLLSLSGLALASMAVYVALRFPDRSDAAPAAAPADALRLLRDGVMLRGALMFFVYVGLEIGFGGWAYTYAIQGAGMTPGDAALVVSTFWGAFTLGRTGAGLVAHWVAGATLVLGGALIVAGGAVVVMLFGAAPAALFLGAALIGAGCAPIFPTAFGLITARYAAAAGAASSLLVLGGSLGGVALPYAQGRILAAGGAPAAAAFVGVLALAVAALQWSLGRAAPRAAVDAQPAAERPAGAV